MRSTLIVSLVMLAACNQAPGAPSVSLSPDPARTTDTLVASIDAPAVDPNKKDELTYSYAWLRDGTAVPELTGPEVPATETKKGETWEVIITPADDKLPGTPATASLVIQNTPPTLQSAALSLLEPKEADALTCIGGTSTDIDGDTVTLQTAWLVNGTEVSTEDTLTGASFNKGDTIQCSLTPFDGTDAGEAVLSDTTTAINTAPEPPTIGTSPQPAFATQGLQCAIITPATDADADDLTYTFTWTLDGTSIGGTGTTSFPGDTIDQAEVAWGQEWTCTVETSDGEATVSVSSDPVTIRPATTAFNREESNDRAGWSVAFAGDVDGDGLSDVLVGAPQATASSPFAGKAYLYVGEEVLDAPSYALADSTYIFSGENEGDLAGGEVASAGDVDGDGRDDLLISGYWNDDGGDKAGKIYLILASSLGAESDISLADADYAFIGASADDQLGYLAMSTAGDVDGDGKDDLLFGTGRNDAGGENAGAGYLVLSKNLSSDAPVSAAEADYVFLGEQPGDGAGYAASSPGDVDGDGLADVIFGAWGNDDGGDDAGKAYLFLGDSLGTTGGRNMADADYSFQGKYTEDYAGADFSFVGDVDGDGIDDVLVGAAGDKAGGENSGKGYIYSGAKLTDSQALTWADSQHRITDITTTETNAATLFAGAGDLDDDGRNDLFVGAWHKDYAGTSSGSTYVILAEDLSEQWSFDLEDAIRVDDGETGYAFLGWPVAGLGDVDGDGTPDLLAGSLGESSVSGATLIFGGALDL